MESANLIENLHADSRSRWSKHPLREQPHVVYDLSREHLVPAARRPPTPQAVPEQSLLRREPGLRRAAAVASRPNRFENCIAKRVMHSNASSGWGHQRAFSFGEKYSCNPARWVTAPLGRLQYAPSPVSTSARPPSGTPSESGPSWVASCQVPRVTRTASVARVVVPERTWSWAKSLRASGSWSARHAPEPKRTRPVASTARIFSTAQEGRAVAARSARLHAEGDRPGQVRRLQRGIRSLRGPPFLLDLRVVPLHGRESRRQDRHGHTPGPPVRPRDRAVRVGGSGPRFAGRAADPEPLRVRPAHPAHV